MVNLSVIDDPKEFAKLLFKAGQQPAAWLWSAGHLRDAAEMILRHELQAEISYSLARKIAEGEAAAARLRYDADSAVADIKATAPNYPPAQLLYAYAIENVLKGLIVLKRPDLNPRTQAARRVEFARAKQARQEGQSHRRSAERTACPRSPHASVDMGGRYPIALEASDNTPNPNALLGYGSAHPIMRTFFERAYKELESGTPEQIPRFEKAGVIR